MKKILIPSSFLVALFLLFFVFYKQPNSQKVTWDEVVPYVKAYLYVDKDKNIHIGTMLNTLSKIKRPNPILEKSVYKSFRIYMSGARDSLHWNNITPEVEEVFEKIIQNAKEEIKQQNLAPDQENFQEKIWEGFLNSGEFVSGFKKELALTLKEYGLSLK